FLLAIPANLILGVIGMVAAWGIFWRPETRVDVVLVFASGFIGLVIIASSLRAAKLRVLIHELKHAVVVKLTGNKIKDFHIERNTGHVKYTLYSNTVHLAPIIALAPYFYPLFSL